MAPFIFFSNRVKTLSRSLLPLESHGELGGVCNAVATVIYSSPQHIHVILEGWFYRSTVSDAAVRIMCWYVVR